MKCTKERCYLNVKADRLEKVVLDTLTKHCFTDENLRLVAAASEYGIDELPASPVTGRITELEQKIQRATDRIAGDVLNDEEFVAVVKIRREWLDELNELKKSIPKADKEPETNLPADLKELRELLEQPELADRSLMRDVSWSWSIV